MNNFNTEPSQVEWRKFEERLPKLSVLRGCTIYRQKKSKTTQRRPDVYAIDNNNSKRRIIVEGKYTIQARKDHLKQVNKYNYPFFPTEKYIVYPRNTEISESFKNEARGKGIEIILLRVEKLKKRRFIIFGKKEYLR
ncbi:MAG TPA: hypothetical protein DDW27_03735 [Bacteroidales bacterium]|nr:hypothetical protein [Bacteroidales bacterium]